jgi:hypothetical protein
MTSLPMPAPEDSDDDPPMPLVAALNLAYRPRLIRPDVTLFVPPGVYPDETESSTERERFASACANVARIVDGYAPESIETAIHFWRLTSVPFMSKPPDCKVLIGDVIGHPKWSGRLTRNVMTSIVLAFAPTEGWALTLSRFYGLRGRT